jgi:predicted nucleotidyltransferase
VNQRAAFENVLVQWAVSASSVRLVWVFGSVAKGKENPGDLDVAVELDAEEPQLFWTDHVSGWRRELQAQLPLKLQLEWFDPHGTTPTISRGLAEGKWLVYERAS